MELLVTKFWGQDIKDYIGRLSLTPEAIKMIEENPEMYQFGISFTGTANEDGTYTDCKLVGVSLIPREKYVDKTKNKE